MLGRELVIDVEITMYLNKITDVTCSEFLSSFYNNDRIDRVS